MQCGKIICQNSSFIRLWDVSDNSSTGALHCTCRYSHRYRYDIYSRYLGNKIARDERQKVELWIEAGRFISTRPPTDTRLASAIITQNADIPIIETNDNDSITAFINLDSAKISSAPVTCGIVE
jgi:hypothetical protein